MFTIKTNQEVQKDEDGKEYIINPITGEKIYRFIPSLIDNIDSNVEANLEPISGLFPKLAV